MKLSTEDKEPKYLSFIIKRKYFSGCTARTNAVLMYPIKNMDMNSVYIVTNDNSVDNKVKDELMEALRNNTLEKVYS